MLVSTSSPQSPRCWTLTLAEMVLYHFGGVWWQLLLVMDQENNTETLSSFRTNGWPKKCLPLRFSLVWTFFCLNFLRFLKNTPKQQGRTCSITQTSYSQDQGRRGKPYTDSQPHETSSEVLIPKWGFSENTSFDYSHCKAVSFCPSYTLPERKSYLPP